MSADATTPPSRVGKYPLVRPLGQGGMATVFLGHHPDLDIPVAVKLLAPALAEHPQMADRFLREAKLAARIDHSNLVRVYDCGQDTGRYFLVMEYVAGPSLQDLVKAGPLAWPVALGYVRDVARALDAAWAHQTVHRDVKPANILRAANGQAKLADLGIAKSLSDETVITQPGAVMGSPAYMAPEQCWEPERIDIRTDLYALGCTAFHLIAGHTPFGGSKLTVMTQHRDAPRPVLVDVPPAVSALVARLMAIRPDDRPASPAELIGELDRLLAAASGTERPVRPGTPARLAPASSTGGTTAVARSNAGSTTGTPFAEVAQTTTHGSSTQVVTAATGAPRTGWRAVIASLLVMIAAGALYAGRGRPGRGIGSGDDLAKPSPAPPSPRTATREELEAALRLGLARAETDPTKRLAALAALVRDFPHDRDAAEAEAALAGRVRTIQGFELLRLETFRCDNDLEGTKVFEVAVYRCTAIHAALRDRLAPGDPAVDTEFVLLPPSGRPALLEHGEDEDEDGSEVEARPRDGQVAPYLIARTEVTQRVYSALGGEHKPFTVEAPLGPATNMGSSAAATWCQRLGLELPSASQWIYACRGGTSSAYCFGSSLIGKACFGSGNRPGPGDVGGPRPVGSFAPNAYGLFDMHGNVGEQTGEGSPGAYGRVTRGGNCGADAANCRVTSHRRDSGDGGGRVGFRPVHSLR